MKKIVKSLTLLIVLASSLFICQVHAEPLQTKTTAKAAIPVKSNTRNATLVQSNGLVSIHQEYRAFKKDFPFNPHLLKLALEAYDCGTLMQDEHNHYILTIVDYQLPSYDKRLWVLNLASHQLLYHTYVAHGAASGLVDATRFSNRVNSDESSIGLYETGRSYDGEWGYAMRLHGLEGGFNSNAYKRDIVMHGGNYVSKRSIEYHGMIGMSDGCFAVPVRLDQAIINTLKNGSLIFAYYPNPFWLDNSKFLHCRMK